MTSRFRFDGWQLDGDSGELNKGGARLRLQDHPLQLLQALLERPGEVVTREQLIERLWPSGVVDFDTGLNAAVRRLRLALGDDAEHARYIETLPRRGYRFIGTLMPRRGARHVRSPFRPPACTTGTVDWLSGALLVVIAPWHCGPLGPGAAAHRRRPAEKSIAVLPFVDLSTEPKQAEFADGMAEEILDLLSRIPGLRVIGRTSSFSFRGHETDLRTIGASWARRTSLKARSGIPPSACA